jgi:hypothetical protein
MSLKVRISGNALDTLAVSASINGEDLETALRKAIALYVESTKAVRVGKSVGITDDPDALSMEFIGLIPN